MEGGGDLRKLFVGKVAVQDLPTVDLLMAGGRLKPPTHFPHFLQNPQPSPLLSILKQL